MMENKMNTVWVIGGMATVILICLVLGRVIPEWLLGILVVGVFVGLAIFMPESRNQNK